MHPPVFVVLPDAHGLSVAAHSRVAAFEHTAISRVTPHLFCRVAVCVIGAECVSGQCPAKFAVTSVMFGCELVFLGSQCVLVEE